MNQARLHPERRPILDPLHPLKQNTGPARSGAAARQASANQPAVPGLRTLLLVFAGYFQLQAISRGLISETLGMDEAQESLLAQKWCLSAPSGVESEATTTV